MRKFQRQQIFELGTISLSLQENNGYHNYYKILDHLTVISKSTGLLVRLLEPRGLTSAVKKLITGECL
jgi:hypothetical protein